jgi:hypothetical protein
MQKIVTKFALPVAIVLLSIVYCYKLSSTFYPDSDYTRDLYQIALCSLYKPTLVGPALRAGFFSGPYYYYFSVPALVLSGLSSDALVYFNALIFAFSLLVVYKITKKISSVLLVGLNPAFIISARHPGNAYSYLPVLVILVTLVQRMRLFTGKRLILLGLLSGFIINYHPSSLLVIIPLFYFIYTKTLDKKYILLYVLALLVTFTPLAIFEFRHEFPVILGMFKYGHYLDLFKNEKIFTWYYLFSPFVIIPLMFRRPWLIAGCLIIYVSLFPAYLYKPSNLHISQIENRVQFVISQNLIKNQSFNVIEVTDAAHKVPMGHSYRFAFLKYGLRPLPETDYASAQKLIIFVSDPSFNVSLLHTWETDQFGGLATSSAYRTDNIAIYSYSKVK